MTKNEIIKLAREAEGTPYVNRHYPGVTSFGFNETTLLAFANLVVAASLSSAASSAATWSSYSACALATKRWTSSVTSLSNSACVMGCS